MTTARVEAAGPGLIETAVMALGTTLLFTDVPWVWFSNVAAGEAAEGGDVLVSVLFLAIAGFLALQMNGRWPQYFSIVGREPLLIALLFWTFISIFWSPSLAITLRRAVALVVTTYLGTHLVLRFSQYQILRIVASVFVFATLLNLFWIVALPQYSGPKVGGVAILEFDNRLTGIYNSPNSLGRVMGLGIFTMLAALKLDRRRRPVYLVGLAAGVLVLAFSQSKTSLVVAILGTALLITYIVFRSRRTLFGAVVVSVFGSGLVAITLVIANLRFFTDALDRDVTLTGRVPLWDDLFRLIPDRLFLGSGYNAFWLGWGSPAQEVWNQNRWLPPHGHNQFIDIALELGLVGLFLYIALLLRTFVRATRYVRDVPGVFGLWPLVFCSLFLLSMITEAAMMSRDISWFLYSGAIVLVSMKKTSIDVPPPPTADRIDVAAASA